MKVLLDENLPHDLRLELTDHDAFTVQYLGWAGTKNGKVLALAAASRFEALITVDSGVPYQQNPAIFPLSVVVLEANSNDMDDLRPLIPHLLVALASLKPKSVVRVG